MKTRITLNAILGLFLLALAGCSSDDSVEQAVSQTKEQMESAGTQNVGVQSMENDIRFAAEAASASQTQIQLGEIVLNRGASSEVKALAQRVVSDHQRIQNDLEETASQRNIVLPDTPGRDHQKIIDSINERNGLALDLAYLREMEDFQEDLIDDYEDAAQEGADLNIRTFASKQLPLLRQHLQLTRNLRNEIE